MTSCRAAMGARANRPARRRARGGQAMVELAIVFPVLLLLAISVFDYGYYLEHVNNITTVVRDGARYASENNSLGSVWNNLCSAPSYTQATGEYNCPLTTSPSNTIESVIQYEAESLTVPEGGLPLDNVDCVWSGNHPSLTASAASLGSSNSCMTVAYYTSGSDGLYTSPVLYGWWSDTSNCFELWNAGSGTAGCTTTGYPAVGTLVQVTVIYNFTKTAPGPAFDVMNAAFGLNAQITAQYTLVVSQ
ncbi:MAG: TadE family protein [Candidatus Dormibacteria bacterium]